MTTRGPLNPVLDTRLLLYTLALHVCTIYNWVTLCWCGVYRVNTARCAYIIETSLIIQLEYIIEGVYMHTKLSKGYCWGPVHISFNEAQLLFY